MDKTRKLHICGRQPECRHYEIEEGEFRLKGHPNPSAIVASNSHRLPQRSPRIGGRGVCVEPMCEGMSGTPVWRLAVGG